MGSPPSQALVHACSGAVAGAVALSLLFPLDTMRIRQQAAATRKRGESTAGALATLRELLQREGIAGLYRGLPSTVIALFYASFFYFFLYNALKTRLKGKSALLVPALAGIANVLASCPVYVLSTRLRTASPGEYRSGLRGFLDCARLMARREGLASFWSGAVPSLWLVTNPTIQWLTYERLKLLLSARMVRRGGGTSSLSTLEVFISGAIAKTLATLATYPLQVAQTALRANAPKPAAVARLETPIKNGLGALEAQRVAAPNASSEGGQSTIARCADAPTGDPDTDGKFAGTLDCLRSIASERGVGGLYSGLGSKIGQTVLTSALHVALYERILRFAEQARERRRNG